MTDHEQWDELAAGYALHGLTPEDDAVFLAHLDTCPECIAGLKQHELVAAQLGSISHYQDDDEAPSWESMRTAILGPRTETTPVADLDERRRRYNVSRRVLAAAAAVVIVAGGGIAIWRVASDGSASCSAAAGCHQIQLAASGRTLAKVVVHGTRVTLTPTNMPAAPAGKTYVLWQQPRAGAATPIGEFTAGTSGPLTIALRAPFAQTSAFAVSLEKSGPPPATPTNMLASGST
jgi:anti-sigma-K factor RskA